MRRGRKTIDEEKFHRLRVKMRDCYTTIGDITEELGTGGGYITQRFKAAHPWKITEIYTICDMLEIPYSEIPEYFSPDEYR